VITSRIADLDTYISNYKGFGIIGRLCFIIDKSEDLRAEATYILLNHLKHTTNTSLYKKIFQEAKSREKKIQNNDHNSQNKYELGEFDSEWVARTEARAMEQLHVKEEELKSISSQHIKETARFGHHDMGEFFYHRGDLQKALEGYLNALEYCSDVRHFRNTCVYIIISSLWLGVYSEVNQFIGKAEKKAKNLPEVLQVQLFSSLGLVELHNRNYREAAKAFTSISPELGCNFCEVLSPCDVAVYGGITALATFSREELFELIANNKSFKSHIELFPIMRELLQFYHANLYANCFSVLMELRKDFLLDVFLSPHFDDLLKIIRQNALISYCSSFLSIRIPKMALVFGSEVSGLEEELINLIKSGKLNAKIDKVNNNLSLEAVGESSALYEEVLKKGKDCNANTSARLLHSQLTKEGLAVT